ncbi:uncharacterized protein N7477_000309 [Penicillium maclennaniae]|uniref:uncharacterized protein n=1 Tax=Penicillium maclennaniae TaxID=1343394 RepID=UPI00253FA3E7|nr:uncharacterized protein N7477_000309 [Penicillium maclennaniae]KAJ5683964.1 hypothetical protein N7477_000309 [Penicillium maclennaniae]
MAAPPEKWYQHAQAPKQRKSSPLKTIALGDGSYFPDEPEIEHVERASSPGTDSAPTRPAKALVREMSQIFGRKRDFRFAAHPYMRLRGGNWENWAIDSSGSSASDTSNSWTTQDRTSDEGRRGDLDDPANYEYFKRQQLWCLAGDLCWRRFAVSSEYGSHLIQKTRAPRAYDSTIGLGGLQWVFDAGNEEASWNGFTQEQVIEFMYRSVEEIMGDWISRDQLRRFIRSGPLAKYVQYVEDPLPPLPPPPKRSFTKDRYVSWHFDGTTKKHGNTTEFWDTYIRDDLATRPGEARDPKRLGMLSQRLFAHMREAYDQPNNVDNLLETSSDEDTPLPPRSKEAGLGTPPPRRPFGTSPVRASAEALKQNPGSLIETDPLHDPELGLNLMDTVEDGGGRTARLDDVAGLPEEKAPEIDQEEVSTEPVLSSRLSPAKTGISEPLRSKEKQSKSDVSPPLSSARIDLSEPSSSNEEERITAGPVSRKRERNKTKEPARKRQKPGAVPTRKAPKRNRKKPDRLGFST